MSFLISVLTGFKFLDRRSDDDVVDKLHYSLTTNVLIGFSILVSWKQFGGKPVECMPPDHYPSSWEQYVENYCWAQDTYYVPEDVDLPLEHEQFKSQGKISYYQWVPFFLLFSAMTFQGPYFIWRIFSHRSGIRLSNLIQHASDAKNVMPDVRPTTIRLISIYIENAMRFHKRLHKCTSTPHRYLKFLNFSYRTGYVTVVYLIIKLLYLLNVIVNFLVMNFFLNTGRRHAPAALLGVSEGAYNFTKPSLYDLYGWHMLREVLNGTQWDQSGFFPRVTVCDFKARVFGFIQKHSVQCVLVINIFNEKIFIFMWFWYNFLMIISLVSFFYWSFESLVPVLRRWFIVRNLELADMPFDPKLSSADVQKFVDTYLRLDGVFALRMINNHTGAIFTSDLTASLWKSFLNIEAQLDRLRTAERVAKNRAKWPSLDALSRTVGLRTVSDTEEEGTLGKEGVELRYRTVPAGFGRTSVGNGDEKLHLIPQN